MNTLTQMTSVRQQIESVNQQLLSEPTCEILIKRSLELHGEYKQLKDKRAIELAPVGTDLVILFTGRTNKYVYYRECDDVYGVEMYSEDKGCWTGTDWKSYNLANPNVKFTVQREFIWKSDKLMLA